jgi:AcrR family transcriptional regulator
MREVKSKAKSQKASVKKTAKGPKKPQRRNAEETIERILKVATKAFAEKGYEGASIKEICRDAGVNMAAIHYHFESRENLYKSIIARFGGAALDAAIRTLQPAASLDEFKTRLMIFMTETIAGAAENPDIALMVIRDMQTHPEILAGFFEKTFGRSNEALVSFFKDAQKKDLIDPSIRPEFAVGSLQAQISFVIGHRRLFEFRYGFDISDAEHRQVWAKGVVDLFVNGLRART